VKKLIISICFLVSSFLLFSQTSEQNYNQYYRFPLSLGVEYQNYTPFAQYGSLYNIFEISGNVRWPIPPVPIIQPTIKGGMLRFDSQDQDDPYKWDNTHWFGGLGLTVSHRFAKNFEISGEIAGMLTQSSFKNLVPEEGTVGQLNIIAEGGLRIALNPSYNFSIDVHPSLKYFRGLGALQDYNGFIFGVGFSGSYRFGKDPDSPQAIIRSIQFGDFSLPPLFAAMQSYYAKNPIGTLIITNTEKNPIKDLQVSFFQAGFMDSPTPAASIPELPGGTSREIPIRASFNQEVFLTEGVTPLTSEIIVTYTSQGRPAEQRLPVSYDLYDKTSVTWDDDNKVAAFITPADSALRNYSSFIRQACKEQTIPMYNQNIQFAAQAFHALSEIGVLYQIDPTLPFTEVQNNPMVIDSISLPRDTLKRITGDCDDLTVLFCSLLETVGIESGFITVPGHIYAVFNTKEQARNFADLNNDRQLTINLDGELWVPVEITMIGKTGFLESWRRGIEEWSAYEEEPEKRGFYVTRKAQELYRPVGLKETDLGLQYGEKENIIHNFQIDMDKIVEGIVSDYVRTAQEQNRAKDWNSLGIAYARFKRYDKAVDAFDKALALNRNFLSADINKANVLFLQGSYPEARDQYISAANSLEQANQSSGTKMVKLFINLSRTYYQLESYDDAQEYFSKAETLDAEAASEYSYLAVAGKSSDSGRAAENENISEEILFFEEEE